MERIDAKLGQAVVLLSRQYLLTDHLIETRGQVLREFERAIEEKRQALDHVLDVYNYVFALIDHLVRYEKIVFVSRDLTKRPLSFEHCAMLWAGSRTSAISCSTSITISKITIRGLCSVRSAGYPVNDNSSRLFTTSAGHVPHRESFWTPALVRMLNSSAMSIMTNIMIWVGLSTVYVPSTSS